VNLKQIAHQDISKPKPDDIRLFMVVRNEALRLPYMLSYYKKLGVTEIFAIDNGSTDDTAKILAKESSCHLFYTEDSFEQFGDWIRKLLDSYGQGCWSLVVDADELLVYPLIERISLNKLCKYLDQHGFKAMHCLLLDMYPQGSLKNSDYAANLDPLSCAKWFDQTGYLRPRVRYYGGMRKRVFGIEPCLTKYPLLRYGKDNIPADGMHNVTTAKIADVTGALLHFKYLQDFHERVVEEAKREQHWNQASEYKAYARAVESDPNFSLDYEESTEYGDWHTLEGKELIQVPSRFKKFAESQP
jgi:hypothetical protein